MGMLLTILLLSHVLYLTNAVAADANLRPNQGLENLVEQLEFRLREVETRMQDDREKLEMWMKYEKEKEAQEKKELKEAMEMRLEAKKTEMETRLEEKDEE